MGKLTPLLQQICFGGEFNVIFITIFDCFCQRKIYSPVIIEITFFLVTMLPARLIFMTKSALHYES